MINLLFILASRVGASKRAHCSDGFLGALAAKSAFLEPLSSSLRAASVD